jgi:hypothetical protein
MIKIGAIINIRCIFEIYDCNFDRQTLCKRNIYILLLYGISLVNIQEDDNIVSNTRNSYLAIFLFLLLGFQFLGTITVADYPFGTNVRINDDITEVIRETPSIAIDDLGNIYMVWTDYINGDPDIYYANSSDRGRTFSPSKRINDDGIGNIQLYPYITVDNVGNIYIAWQDGRNDLYDVYFTNSSNGGKTFSPNLLVDSAPMGESQEYPSLAVDDAGIIYIGWMDDEGTGDWNIYLANSTDGGVSFSLGKKVNDDISTTDQWISRIAAEGIGNVYVVWEDERTDIWGDVYFSKSTDGGDTFSPNKKVDDSPAGISIRNPEIALDDSKNIYITWTDNRSAGWNVIFTNSSDGGLNFSPNKIINDDGPGIFHNGPHIAAFGNGQINIVWDDIRSGSDFDIYYAESDDWGITFSPNYRVNDDIGNANQYGTDISLDKEGLAYIVWTDERVHFIDVYFASNLFAITEIEVFDITDTTATISWISNRPANSTVEYGFKGSYGFKADNNSKVTSHEMNLTNLEPGRLYHFQVISYNSLENYTRSGDFTFTTLFPINLEPGWNLISLPLNQTITAVNDVFQSIVSDYDAVQWFNATESMDPWKHHHISKPPFLNDLNDVNRTMGIWIHITNPLGTTLYVNGTAPEVGYINQITLRNGWNFVGYPSLIERIAPFNLPGSIDMVQWYNASSGIWESWDPGTYAPDNLNSMKPGQGFWIHNPGTATQWSLEYVN